VVGFPQSADNPYIAVRGKIFRGTTIYGVSFYSNDATTFPEVFLAKEARPGRLPEPGPTLRSQTQVQAEPGYTTVALEPYSVTKDEYLWLLVRFPEGESVVRAGRGGGAGVGWVEETRVLRGRSFFSANESMNEFTPSFDILFVTESSLMTTNKSRSRAERGGVDGHITPKVVVGPNPMRVNTQVHFELAVTGSVDISIFDVSGRLVRHIVGATFPPGRYSRHWDGTDHRGQEVGSGIYMVKFMNSGNTQHRKLVLLR
jgi:hypothetical protein